MPRPDPRPHRGTILAAVLMACLGASGGTASAGPAAGEEHPPPAPEGLPMSAEMEAVTQRVLCPCGTCVNQTLHQCTCGTAAMERDRIAAALSAGRSADAIVEEYVQQYGLQILNAPDKEGFNLFGWMVPFIATTAGLVSLIIVLARWRRLPPGPAGDPVAPPASSTSPGGEESDYRRRVEEDLEEMQI